MKSSVRKALILLLTAIFIVSGSIAIYRMIEQKRAEESYSEAETLVNLPDLQDIPVTDPPASTLPVSQEPHDTPVSQPSEEVTAPEESVYVDPYADALRNMDFTTLREVNSDILGWILIPNTRVSYPLVQGEDNDYYLNRTWRKVKSDVGSIFLEQQCSSDLSDFNTIIYGHRMNNGSMFGSLKEYRSAAYWKQHPIIYITDDTGVHAYEIFAAYEADVTGMTYRIGSFGDAEKHTYIEWCLVQSVIDTSIVPTVDDQIVTLSTCTGNGYETRWVVHGVKRGETSSAVSAAE